MSSMSFGTKDDNDDSSDEIIIGSSSKNTESLQDSFLKFRDMKKKERHILKLSRQGVSNVNGERSESFKSCLREKFIDAAKRYIGVPYAKRFKAEDEPEAPLYLDCCALVRRAVMDLQDDFGIILGKWNQAYQMDTLPLKLLESELRPGDLIFYEGLYLSKRSKVQKHNNVHVEIFLGGETGEATIGSRFHNGKVSIFPSYKFTSTKWSLVQYHFRSLDTWLEGECRSYCPEHPWHSDILSIEAAAGRKSIFNDGSDDELAECYSDDSECDGLYDNLVHCANETAADQTVADLAMETESLTISSRVMSKIDGGGSSLRSTSPTTRPSGSLDDLEALLQRPKSASHDTVAEKCILRSRTICVGKRGGAAREGLGLLPGHSAVVQKGRKSISDADRAGIQRSECRAASLSQGRTKTSNPHTYYVGKSNGWRLVKDSLDRRGWQQLPFEYSFSSRFSLKWVERRSQIDYKAHTPGQLVNHIPNNDCISTKIGLLRTLREKYCRVKAVSTTRLPTPWLPETYELDSPADVAAIFEVENRLVKEKAEETSRSRSLNLNSDDDSLDCIGESKDFPDRDMNAEVGASSSSRSAEEAGCIWIYKPSCNNRGRGIKVVRGTEALSLLCYGKPGVDSSSSIPPSPGILQRYVENPLLVGAEALKFDVRCYMLIASTEPYRAYYHPGYCRLSLKTYSTSAASLEDPTVHLTNASVQKKDPLYALNKEQQVQDMRFNATIHDNHLVDCNSDYLELITSSICSILRSAA